MIPISHKNRSCAFSYRKYFVLLILFILFAGVATDVVATPPEIFDAVGIGESLVTKKRMILKRHPEWTPERRMQFEERFSEVSRKWESKRQNVLKKAHGMIKSLKTYPPRATGTEALKGRGIVGDVDFQTLNRSEVKRVAEAYRKLGYTVVESASSVTIKELNTTYFRPVPGGINSEAAYYDPEVMDIRKISDKMSPAQAKSIKSRQVADNLKKMHGYGNMDPQKFLEANPSNGGRLQAKSSKLQELAKATTRIDKAMGKKPFEKKDIISKLKTGTPLTIDQKIAGLRHGIEMETLGITKPGASNDEVLKAIKNIQKECWKRTQKGYRFKANLDREISGSLKSSYKKMVARGEFKGANQIKRELVQHKIYVARQDKGILKNRGFDDLASVNGYKKTVQTKKIKNPKTGKMSEVKKTYFKKDVSVKDPKTGKLSTKNKQFTRAQVNKAIRKANIKEVVRAGQIGSRTPAGQLKTNTSKNIKISQTDAKSYSKKKVTLQRNKIALQRAKIGNALLMGISIYHGGKQAIDETSLEITEDTTNWEIAGKTAKVMVKTLYYASGLGSIKQVQNNVFNQVDKEYERSKAAGEDPSLAWAYTKGSLRTVNDLGVEMIKGMTTAPLVQTYNIVEGMAGTINSKMDAKKAEAIAAEMADRVSGYKREVALRGLKTQKAFAKLQGQQSLPNQTPEDGRDPVTDLDIAYGITLEENLDQSKKEYKAALDRAGGKKTPEVTEHFKKLEQHITGMERYVEDPGYERKMAQSNANITRLNEKIAVLTRQNAMRASGIDQFPGQRAVCDDMHRAGKEIRRHERAIEDANEAAEQQIDQHKKNIEKWKTKLRSKTCPSQIECKSKINEYEESLDSIYSAVERGEFRSATGGASINESRNRLKLAEKEEAKLSSQCYDKPAPQFTSDPASCNALTRLNAAIKIDNERIEGSLAAAKSQFAQHQEAIAWWQDQLMNGTGYSKEESKNWIKTHEKLIERTYRDLESGEFRSQSNAYSLKEIRDRLKKLESEKTKLNPKCYGSDGADGADGAMPQGMPTGSRKSGWINSNF